MIFVVLADLSKSLPPAASATNSTPKQEVQLDLGKAKVAEAGEIEFMSADLNSQDHHSSCSQASKVDKHF